MNAMIAFLNYLIDSYNVWFTAPLAIVFLFALFRLVAGGIDFGDADVDADIDAAGDMGADSELEHTSFADAFGFLNVGRVPLMVVLTSLFATWGISGLTANALFNISVNPQWFWASCVVAFFCSVLGTRYLSIALSKLFPESERAVTDTQLLGLHGRVISGQITTTFGTARVQVPNGPQLTVSCRTKPGEAVPKKGDTVILVNYNDAKRIFDVKKAEVEIH